MTANQREKGTKSSQPLAESWELVLFRQLRERESGRAEMFEQRSEDGMYLGIEDKSVESRIGTAYGFVKARDVRRKPDSERLCASAMRMFTGAPWDPAPEGSADIDGAPVGNPLDPRPKIVDHGELGMAARRLRLDREDVEAHGYTESCEGCSELRLGRVPKNHNERCRSRMEATIAAESEDGRRRFKAAYGSTA